MTTIQAVSTFYCLVMAMFAVQSAVEAAGADEATTTAIVDDYRQAQIQALKTGMLVAALPPHVRPGAR